MCDVDGTIAIKGDRSPYDESKVYEDEIDTAVYNVLKVFGRDEYPIIILSGRKDSCRGSTENWLEKYNIQYKELYMRKIHDNRQDSIVKREIFEAHIQNKYNVLVCLDDRNQVVDLWRSIGIPCFQVWYGNF